MPEFQTIPFEQCIADGSIEVVSPGKYRVAQLIQQRAALAASALQPSLLDSLGYFPIGRHTPGGVPVQNSNIAAAIRSAFQAARDSGGGLVLIPPGAWMMGDEEFEWHTDHTRNNVEIHGSGMDTTSLNWAEGFSGTAFKFTGEAYPGDFLYNGGISNISINCESAHVSNDGVGIHIEACINSQFRNVTIRNFLGGTGFKTRKVGADGTNQYIQLHNFTCATNRINFDLQSFVNSQGYGVYGNSGAYREFLCDDVKASFYGGNVQTSAPIAIELLGEGLCRLVIFDFYYEGFCPLILKCNSPSVTFNTVDVHGFHLGGNPDVFADVDAFNNVTLTNIYGAGNAATILKARNGAPVCLINVGDPISSPSYFDLDAASRANLVCLGYGSTQFFGTRVVGAKGYSLPSYATDAEPAGAVNGEIVQNADYERPTVKTSTGWKRAAYVDDAIDLNALLAPYCAEIFDPRIKKLRSVISGGLDSLTGLLAGSVLSAPGAGQRPVWNASDDAFGNRPSFSCANSGDHFLQGALATPVAVSSRMGSILIFRVNVAGTDVNRRVMANFESTVNGIGVFCGYGDLNQTANPYCYYTTAPATGSLLMAPPVLDLDGHVMLINGKPEVALHYDENSVVTGSDTGGISHALDRATLGGCSDSAVYRGSDVTLAYAAVLKQALPDDVRKKVMRAALTTYGLR